MLFNYKAVEKSGQEVKGVVEAISLDVAIGSVQKKGFMIIEIEPAEKKYWFSDFNIGKRVSNRDIVVLSRQMAILFEAQVSPIKIFSMLAAETENKILSESLSAIVTDIQGGQTISKSLAHHPAIFSDFYVNMVRSGEETGKLNETFSYLADYLERNYEVISKVKNALIYPAFVIGVFISVMVLMFTFIIPKIGTIIADSGQEVPIYTKFVLGISGFFVDYGVLMLACLVVVVFFLIRYIRTPDGRRSFASFKLELPYLGTLYRKLYLSIIADNMNTMIFSGIPILKTLEVSSSVVANEVYKDILDKALTSVKGGIFFPQSFSGHPEIPNILVQMIKVGEETGELGSIFKTMARFYRRDVINAVDTLVSLIEPALIVMLGLGVGTLLASVLVPIYNIANSAGAV